MTMSEHTQELSLPKFEDRLWQELSALHATGVSAGGRNGRGPRRRSVAAVAAAVVFLAGITAAVALANVRGSSEVPSGSRGATDEGGAGQQASSDDATAGGAAADLPTDEFELSREVALADGSVLAEGDTAAVADLLDGERPVVLNFFASWCAPCRAEMPDLQKVFEDIEGEVNLLALTVSDDEDLAAELVEEIGVSYPWAHPGNDHYVDFGLFGMPSTVYISPEGEVLEVNNGATTEDEVRDRLSDLFGVET